MKTLIENLNALLWPAVSLGAALAAGLIARYLVFWVLARLAVREHITLYSSLLRHCKRPTLGVFPIAAVYFVLPLIKVSPKAELFISSTFRALLIVSVAWLAAKLVSVLEDIVLSRYHIGAEDNLSARKIFTQFRIIRTVLIFLIVLLTAAAVLMTSERFRQLGAGILASAGVTGMIVGFAARSTLTNLLAGIQTAITQPIRLDDVLIVEKEWGRAEEITFTYVVLRLWDLRRLIIPISYFIEKPFENWTRTTANLIGSAYLYVDYTVPVRELRDELQRILRESPLWDGEVAGLQVTDARESTMQVRVIIGAADSGNAWNPRCEVREKLVEFVQTRYPHALPRIRAELIESPGNLLRTKEA
jgi:small-conductance mechanosensitive channel